MDLSLCRVIRHLDKTFVKVTILLFCINYWPILTIFVQQISHCLKLVWAQNQTYLVKLSRHTHDTFFCLVAFVPVTKHLFVCLWLERWSKEKVSINLAKSTPWFPLSNIQYSKPAFIYFCRFQYYHETQKASILLLL